MQAGTRISLLGDLKKWMALLTIVSTERTPARHAARTHIRNQPRMPTHPAARFRACGAAVAALYDLTEAGHDRAEG